MIDNALLLAEITTDPVVLGYAGAGARPLSQLMNKAGSASESVWIASADARPVEKETFLQLLSMAEAAALQGLMDGATPEGLALKFKLSQSKTIDMSKTPNRDFMEALKVAGVVTTATRDSMLKLGEVEQSRAQELWNEPVTVDQIKGVL